MESLPQQHPWIQIVSHEISENSDNRQTFLHMSQLTGFFA